MEWKEGLGLKRAEQNALMLGFAPSAGAEEPAFADGLSSLLSVCVSRIWSEHQGSKALLFVPLNSVVEFGFELLSVPVTWCSDGALLRTTSHL